MFDLLCYLVRHRERVVPKNELLEALWPGSVVVDNALQRVVSLARTALDAGGMADAVRTYPRHGYRFCVDDCTEVAGSDQTSPAVETQAVEHNQDWLSACETYAAADRQTPLSPDDVEQWGRAAICAGRGLEVVEALERAVALRDADADALGAARATLLLLQIRIDHKQRVMANGLLQRAARYTEGHVNSAERGHYAWMASRMALGGGDADTALAMADEACRLGRALRDPDIECLGLSYRGHALMLQGNLIGALANHEEAAAVIRLGRVRSWVAGWALCGFLSAARYRGDWLRAAHFAEAFVEWSRDSRMPAFPGTCQLHRAAVLCVQGRLDHAESEVRAAAALVAKVAPWAEGDAYCILGDIQLGLRNYEGAETSYRQAYALGWSPQPGLARLHLMTDRPELAQRGLEVALNEQDWTLLERRGQLLCLLASAAVAAGDTTRAREVINLVGSDPEMQSTDQLKALFSGAQAELAIADSDLKRAAMHLRQAVRNWREAGSPTSEVETRLRLAECLLQDRDAAGSELELHAVTSSPTAGVEVYRARLNVLQNALATLRNAAVD